MDWNVILNLVIIFVGGFIFISIAEYILSFFIRIK